MLKAVIQSLVIYILMTYVVMNAKFGMPKTHLLYTIMI